ncbi:hypothetical protein ACQP2Y_14635 [Actinoplanes sp. CA-051413]|uniref:hypothetical protein n=1 Tax=Actinoplanes sp. CA-051413 TaxID=3239899 RepID=UPI003D98546C
MLPRRRRRLRLGYRHIDVGRAVRDSGIPREQVYLDLYLIHAPWPWDQMGKDCREENRQI